METRQAYLKMIKAFPGGWDAISAALGMSKIALENRVYERKQQMHVETAMQMQKSSGTTHFAQAIAAQSGGVFVPLPNVKLHDQDELLAKFNQLYARLGELSQRFADAIEDGEIDRKERSDLDFIAQQIHRTLQELLGTSFAVYCRGEG